MLDIVMWSIGIIRTLILWRPWHATITQIFPFYRKKLLQTRTGEIHGSSSKEMLSYIKKLNSWMLPGSWLVHDNLSDHISDNTRKKKNKKTSKFSQKWYEIPLPLYICEQEPSGRINIQNISVSFKCRPYIFSNDIARDVVHLYECETHKQSECDAINHDLSLHSELRIRKIIRKFSCNFFTRETYTPT